MFNGGLETAVDIIFILLALFEILGICLLTQIIRNEWHAHPAILIRYLRNPEPPNG